jgi:hypothetical protein|tara:strand:+ start:566 stop:715 length:150 start_codon:yes stop_codon:yes gene_type:complete
MRLKVKKEYQGYNGERKVIEYITYDPNTGKEYDVADIYEMENDNVYNIK